MMTRPMLERLHVQNYGCIKDATFVLSPLHALIGPNDSGKSTALHAVLLLSLIASADRRGEDEIRRQSQLLGGSERPTQFGIFMANNTWSFEILRDGTIYADGPTGQRDQVSLGGARVPWLNEVSRALSGAQLLHLEPRALRQASGLIPDGQPLRLLDDRGAGLPGVYDAVFSRDLSAYAAINEQLKAHFPAVKSLSLRNVAANAKSLGVQLHGGTYVSAEHMSEGLLYYLAFAALPYLEPTPLLLLEEPENGLHPARIRQVMTVLREVSKVTQVIIATHSPLVINELEGHEVSVLTRTLAEGTKATLVKDTPNFEERSKVYALGELWVSYADGKDESALLQGGARP